MEQCRSAVSSSFASSIDSKGRALINSQIRKKLQLKFGSSVKISSEGKSFLTKIDERGRFNVPASVRKNVSEISGFVQLIVRDSLSGKAYGLPIGKSSAPKTGDCGSPAPGSKPRRCQVPDNPKGCPTPVASGVGEYPGRGPEAYEYPQKEVAV